MSEAFKPPTAIELLRDLQHNEELKHQPSAANDLHPQLAMLREWQANRLTHTYADLRADPHYSPACEFFLSDIYAPRDFSQRDHDLDRIHKFLSRVLPATTIQLLTMTVELNSLTNTLDQHLLQVLVQTLGVTDTLTAELYAEAYRVCDTRAERVRQIDLIQSILKQVSKGARRSVVSVALKMAKTPAHRAGWVDVYDFLERGYLAFRPMKDATIFVEAIGQRETNILDRIYAADVAGFKQLAGLR